MIDKTRGHSVNCLLIYFVLFGTSCLIISWLTNNDVHLFCVQWFQLMATDIEWQHILVTTTEWPLAREAEIYSFSHRYIFTIYKYTKYDPDYVLSQLMEVHRWFGDSSGPPRHSTNLVAPADSRMGCFNTISRCELPRRSQEMKSCYMQLLEQQGFKSVNC